MKERKKGTQKKERKKRKDEWRGGAKNHHL
jgi:hypothetical protein